MHEGIQPRNRVDGTHRHEGDGLRLIVNVSEWSVVRILFHGTEVRRKVIPQYCSRLCTLKLKMLDRRKVAPGASSAGILILGDGFGVAEVGRFAIPGEYHG